MNKKTGLYLMIGGAALSIYDYVSDGALYGTGKPLASMKWKIYTTSSTPPKDWFLSISDIAALAGAFLYFR